MIARFVHTLHICFRPHLWLLHLAHVVAAVAIAVSSQTWSPSVTQAFLMGFFEVFGTIAVGFGLHHVLTVDGDDGAREVLLTYPASRPMLAVERFVAGLVLTVGPLLLVAVGLQLFLRQTVSESALGIVSLRPVLLDSATSWIYVAGLTVLASVLAGSWMAGLLASGLYWMTDLLTDGQCTSQLYLFYGTFKPGTVVPELNRLLLVALGIATSFAAILAYGRTPHRR